MRHAILQISDNYLVQILKRVKSGFNGRFKVTKNGLPEDANVVRSYSKDGIVEKDLSVIEYPLREEE